MAETPYRWYWAWRGWRASTWAFLLWSALCWPSIVSTARSDELFAEQVAFVLVVAYLVGVGAVLATRAFSKPKPRRISVLAKALPFVAAAALALLLLNQLVASTTGGPSGVESAVESEWHGDSYPLWFSIGGGDPVTVGTNQESADEVTCAETGATVGGSQVHQCTIAYCDYDETVGVCYPATATACAALVSGRLVLVSRKLSLGPPGLRAELDRKALC
jgi:hypothetical protein